MSTEAVERSFQDSDATGTRAQVLTYLCWRANGEGLAWPKRGTIAEATGVSEKQVKRHVQALVETGELWYKPGRGRGNISTYVPTVGLEKGDIQRRLMNAGLEKGDADGESDRVIARRKGDICGEKGDTSPEKGDTDRGLSGSDRDEKGDIKALKGDTDGQKGDTDGGKAPAGGKGLEKGTPEKRGHSGGEKGTPVGSFPDPPNDNTSNPPKAQTIDKQTEPEDADSAPARENGDPWGFLPEGDHVYHSTMQDSAEEFSETSIDRLIRRHWGGYRQGKMPISSMKDLLEDLRSGYGDGEGFRRFVAAVVITGDQADTPNLKFVRSTAQNFDRYRDQDQRENGRHATEPDDEWALVDG